MIIPTTLTTTVRPYRLWNPATKKALPWRCYLHLRNAQIGALIEAKYMAVGSTIEVYDITSGSLKGQYTRRVNGIDIYKEKQ